MLPYLFYQQLLFYLLTSYYFNICDSNHEELCGGRKFTYGKFSIGSGVEHAAAMSPYAHTNHRGSEHIDTSITNHLTVYPIKYVSSDMTDAAAANNMLFGWLHVRLDVGNKDGYRLGLLMMQGVVPKTGGAGFQVGEFVATKFNPGCKEYLAQGDWNDTYFSKSHLAPCFYAPDPATSVPQMFAFGERDYNRNYGLEGPSGFNYRTDFPECGGLNEGSPFKFGFFASIDSWYGEPYRAVIQNEILFSNKAYGGYDPAPPRNDASLTCKSGLESNSSSPEWIAKHDTPSSFPPVPFWPECFIKVHDTSDALQRRFHGRCILQETGKWTVSPDDAQYTCREPNPDSSAWPPYEPAVRPGACKQCEKTRNITLMYGVSANSLIGRYIWSFRTTHGLAMSFSTMFLAPGATLFARYFKETHMSYRFVNLHVWHGVHISTILTLVGGLFSGMTAGVVGRAYFGFSWHPVAITHVALGWVSIILFILSLVTGPVRLYPMMSRVMSIFCHFLVGSLTRLLWTFCLLTCFHIPASPAAMYDIHMELRLETGLLIILSWIVVDIAVHILLQVQLSGFQRNWPRTYAVAVPIPIIRPFMEQDAPGTLVRNLVLLAHAAFNFVLTLYLWIVMCSRDPKSRFFGKMGYTHNPDGKLNTLFKDVWYRDEP